MPKVSVVIPTYNRAELLRPCLESLANQTYRDFEAVVIDDGSTDHTPEVASGFDFVRYFHQENQGVPGALNRGVRESTGEFVAFLASDDELIDGALATEAALLDERPKVGLVYAQAWEVDEDGNILALRKPAFATGAYIRSGIDEIRDLAFACHVTCSTVMVRKRCLDEVGLFDPEFSPLGEDWDMWVRIARRFDVAYINQPLGIYRVHSGPTGNVYGRTDTRTLERLRLRQMERIFLDDETGHLFADIRDKAYSRHHWLVATKAYKSGEMALARAHALKAIAIRPGELLTYRGIGVPLLLVKSLLPGPLLHAGRSASNAVRHLRSHGSSDLAVQTRSER